MTKEEQLGVRILHFQPVRLGVRVAKGAKRERVTIKLLHREVWGGFGNINKTNLTIGFYGLLGWLYNVRAQLLANEWQVLNNCVCSCFQGIILLVLWAFHYLQLMSSLYTNFEFLAQGLLQYGPNRASFPSQSQDEAYLSHTSLQWGWWFTSTRGRLHRIWGESQKQPSE